MARSSTELLVEIFAEDASLENNTRIARAESALGASLGGLGRFQEAEPLLLRSYSILKEKAEAQRLVDLYESWGKPASALEYRAFLEEER